ncbi:MAG TPA: glycerophosphodiester phosphodiesterase [Firmicutes bacterium]|jgi:glycerophosphoryl diester phosphodiesterase|nr:glycerophosphodiester phosphodiesterase [Bacillota bacterium]HCF93362.1 glycerophosphodiester phosphodiesterase [Bacillota bacterium]HCM17565.1 glycerophosphodiester phosphodiesterase [Bacillota bacterium]HCT36161.1 glycerophosphodiester phosphodiesterase [Bacillota bacterium]
MAGPKKKHFFRRKTVWIPLVIVAFIFLNNSSFLVRQAQHADARPLLLAHRGLAQNFPMAGITGDTNTAQRIYEPEHPYLENTIPSMQAAFLAGADMVEFDVQRTKDGQLAVFHDSNLEYRTNGQGSVKDYTMQELKTLDAGYGYTADQGASYPFRGKAIGMIPSLDEVLSYFPEREFLIHIKNNDSQDGALLAEYLKKLADGSAGSGGPESRDSDRLGGRLARICVYGGNEPIAILKEELPNLRVMSRATTKKALISYLALGWTGYMPASMQNAFFYLPLRYARFLWGWPHRFIKRIEAAGSVFVIVAGEGQWSEGFDTVEDLQQIPENYAGGIWTNRIDRIAPVFMK